MTKEQKIIRAKVGLLELARQLGNVSQACKMMGYSRDSFYRQGALRRRRRIGAARADAAQAGLKNRTPPLGRSISPAGVRGVWQRHDLETMKKRLKALEAKVAQEGLVLTESQLAALEKAKSEKEAQSRVRERMSGLLRRPGYVLRRQHEGGRPHLPADLHRHLRQGRPRQALGVWSQLLMEHPYRVIRRMRYGPSSTWKRHDDRGGPSSDTA